MSGYFLEPKWYYPIENEKKPLKLYSYVRLKQNTLHIEEDDQVS